MRLPQLTTDFWELESGEARHEQSPATFWIPPREDRENLRVGQAVKLTFHLEGDDDGAVVTQVERMWVWVSEVRPDGYVGILDDQPGAYEPSDDIYLVMGAEVPFLSEHVIDIADPPPDYVAWQTSNPPLRRWPRD